MHKQNVTRKIAAAISGAVLLLFAMGLDAEPVTPLSTPPDPLVRLVIAQGGDTALTETMMFARIILGRTKIPFKIEHVPWDRALKMVTTRPNTLMSMMSRTAERETQFLWVAPVRVLRYQFYRDQRREDVQASSLDEIGRYRLGVVGFGDVVTRYLLDKRLISKSHLEVARDDVINLRKLMNGRIDLITTSDAILPRLCARAAIDCGQLFAVLELPEHVVGGMYMAYSKGTDASVVQRTFEAYADAIRDPSLEKIATAALGAELFNQQSRKYHEDRKGENEH